eukprot:1486774-Pyramimonas_sp.AAC.1
MPCTCTEILERGVGQPWQHPCVFRPILAQASKARLPRRTPHARLGGAARGRVRRAGLGELHRAVPSVAA